MGRKLEAWKQAAKTPDRVTGKPSNPQGEDLLSRTAQHHQCADLATETSTLKLRLLPRIVKGCPSPKRYKVLFSPLMHEDASSGKLGKQGAAASGRR